MRDADKRRLYRAHEPDAYDFVPLSHESFGRLGRPAMELLNKLADTAVRCGDVRRDVFVTNALRRLSVGLCKGNAFILLVGLRALAEISGRAVLCGLDRPSVDA